MSESDRLPPHSPEAEQGVLGCVLLSPSECLAASVERLGSNAEAFYDLRHQTIFTALAEMNSNQEAVDVITLQQRLKDRQLLEQVGGIGYLASLPDAVPSAANLGYYLDIVQEKYLMRRMVIVGCNIATRVYESSDSPESILDQAERDVLAIRNSIRQEKVSAHIKESVKLALTRIEQIWERQGQLGGIATGYRDLDKHTDGLHPGELILISAYPSSGKTALMLNIAEHAALTQQVPVGIFELEMTSEQLATRLVCSQARINLFNVRDGIITHQEFPRITTAAVKVSAAPIYVDDSADLSIHQLRAKARRMVHQFGIKLFGVDHLQLMNASGGNRRPESRQQELEDISNGLKAMAKELNLPVIVLSQLNDDGMIRGSRAPGQDADGVWKLEPQEEGRTPDVETVLLKIRKNRNGPRDITVPLTFLKSFTRFESAARVSDEDVP